MSWAAIKQEPIVEGFNELLKAKRAFAKAFLYNPDNTYQAGLAVFGFDTTKALRASNEWPNDPEVIAEKEKLLNEFGSLHFLPDKSAVARKIITIADETKVTSERLLAYRLYSDLMGFIEKPGSAGGAGNTNVFMGQNRVMVVSTAGTDEEWANRAANHQALLVKQAAEDIGVDEDEEASD